ncbi:hypothetical protein [Arthrobacter sp. B3I4]|uniref:hypothetical protein n=1 Tax=Arthrobacter sp. B3I4 TaxID=3042267 RepID=UPI0027D8B370|nr:hypothetical protein [Arthrobacter sp. B3I4]
MHSVSPSYAAAELKAHEQRSNHAFADAANSAERAAEIALQDGNFASWWNMTFLQAENLLDAQRFGDCETLAASLITSLEQANLHDQARVHILLAKARQGAGLLEQAAASARAATDLTAGESEVELNIKARQALIAALADGGKLSDAWRESMNLAGVVSDDIEDQLAGKAYWVIGNVAFLCDRVEEGLRYHELAAATFSPAKNLDVWAKFNKASAAMRLAANVADADTLRCIERAELATDVIGGSETDVLLLKRNRAHWSYLAGDAGSAVTLLEEIRATVRSLTPQILGDVCLLLGRSYLAVGDKVAARQSLREAEVHFRTAGAPHRAQQAKEVLLAELGRTTVWSRIGRKLTSFGRH